MNVVVEFGAGEGPRVESNGMDFSIGSAGGENGCKSIVGGVSLNNERSLGVPVNKDRSGGECLLECLEGGPTFISEEEHSTFVGEAGKRDSDVGVAMNEVSVEISTPKEGLDVLNLLGLRPILDGLNFARNHGEAIGGDDVA